MAKRKQPKRILLALPAGTGNRALCDATWESLQAVEWPHELDYYFMRNDEPDTPHAFNLRDKFNRAREVALAQNYDALWIVESDMIVPPHALQRMARANGDIVYALYCSRRAGHYWLATDDNSRVIERFVSRTGRAKEVWGKVAQTQGLGTGCTLIHRAALEKVEFRCEPEADEESKTGAPDWYLAIDAEKAGLRQVHDFGVVCGHIINPDPLKIVWPIAEPPYHRITDAAADAKAQRKALTTAQAGQYIAVKAITVKSTNRRVEPGESLYLDAGSALHLMRRGIVTPAMEKGDDSNNS